ncbi:MAG: hypothetical protein AB1765_00375 [Candidatus Hydrogenedentota bacterium]
MIINKKRIIIWVIIVILGIISVYSIWYSYKRYLDSHSAFINRMQNIDKKIAKEPMNADLYLMKANLIYFKALKLLEEIFSAGENVVEGSDTGLYSELDNSVIEIAKFWINSGYLNKSAIYDVSSINDEVLAEVIRSMFEKAKDLYLFGLPLAEKVDGVYQFRIGECYFRMGRNYFDEAELMFKYAQELGIKEIKIYVFLGNIKFIEKDIDASIDYYDRALKLQPDNMLIKFNKAIALKEKNELDKVIELLNEIIKTYETSERVTSEEYSVYLKSIYTLGRVYYLKKEFDKSREVFEMMIERESEMAPVLYWLGKTYMKEGDDTFALSIFERLEKIKPDYKDTRQNIRLLRKKRK